MSDYLTLSLCQTFLIICLRSDPLLSCFSVFTNRRLAFADRILWEDWEEVSKRCGLWDAVSLRRGLFETQSLWDWSQSLTSVLLPAEYLLLVCITQTQNLVSCLASVWLKWHKHDGFTATDQRKLVSVSKIPDSVKTPQTSTSELPAGSQHHWHWCSVSWSLKSTFHSASWFLLCLRIKRNT